MNTFDTDFERLINQIEKGKDQINLVSIVTKDKPVSEYIHKQQEKYNMHSIAKSIVSLAAGFAVEEGLLSLNDSAARLFPDKVNESNFYNLDKVVLKDFLSLGVGQDKKYLMMGQRNQVKEGDWLEYCLSKPFVHEPGKAFSYSNVGPYLAGRAVEEKSGQNLIEYLTPRLFKPLGISAVEWERDPEGHIFGSGGIILEPEYLKKLAFIFLNDGKYRGNKIISSEWIKEMSSPQIEIDYEDAYATHYGFGMWVNARDDYYRADGAFGQIILIIPEKETAVIVCSLYADNHTIMKKITDFILPNL